MKKIILVLAVMLAALFAFGCADAPPDAAVPYEAAVTSDEKTAEPTKDGDPAPDVSGYRIVTGNGMFSGRETPPEGGYVFVADALREAVDNPANADALFEVNIWYSHGEAKLSAEVNERIRAEIEADSERMNEIYNEPAFAEFNAEFSEWFNDVYFPDCPYKDRYPLWGEPGMWQAADNLLADTLFEPGFDYYDKFFAYLEENGGQDKAEIYRPLAEEYWQLGYKASEHYIAEELYDVCTADCRRLIELGYRIDLDRLSPKRFGCTAYLTREQITDFDNDMDFGYELTFPIDWSYLEP